MEREPEVGSATIHSSFSTPIRSFRRAGNQSFQLSKESFARCAGWKPIVGFTTLADSSRYHVHIRHRVPGTDCDVVGDGLDSVPSALDRLEAARSDSGGT